MRITDRRWASPRVLAACLVAFAALGGAATAGSRASKITFTNAKLLHNWKYGGNDSAQPGYAIDSLGVVHLRGGLSGGSKSATAAFALPPALRPTQDTYVPVYAGGTLFICGTHTRATVCKPGDVFPEAPGPYWSLDGISFVAGSHSKIKFTNAKLLNGWRSAAQMDDTSPPAYAEDSLGVIHLQGEMFDGASGKVAFVLPKALRPSRPMWLTIQSGGAYFGSLMIGTGGQVTPIVTGTQNDTVLDAISFVAGGSTKVHFTNAKLVNGWASASYGNAAPGYAKDSLGVVHLRGGLANGTSGDEALILPKALWPSHELRLRIYTYEASDGSLIITAGGQVIPVGSEASEYASLDGISFVAGQ